MTGTGASAERGAPGKLDGGDRIGGLVGIAGAIVAGTGLILIDRLPNASAGAPEVYAFFLDETGGVARPSALIAIGLIGVLVLFSTLRGLAGARRASRAAAVTMLALAQVGIALEIAALVTVGVLTVRPQDADPGSSRALLDLSEALSAIGGAGLAGALIATALTVHRTRGLLPALFIPASLIAAAGCALWVVRLLTDTSAFASDSILGSGLGWVLFIVWALAVGIWLLLAHPEEPESEIPVPEDEPAGRRLSVPIPKPRLPRRRPKGQAKSPELDLPEPKLPPSGRKPFVPPAAYPGVEGRGQDEKLAEPPPEPDEGPMADAPEPVADPPAADPEPKPVEAEPENGDNGNSEDEAQ